MLSLPQILYRDFGLKLISPNKPFYLEGDVFIGGAPYASKYHSKQLIERLQNIEKSSRGYEKRILVLHQGIDRYIPYEYEIKIGDVPQSFNYCAFGHIHERVVDDFGEGKLAYPGSTEIWRSNELEGYKKNGKGFYLVDLSGDMPEIENIDLKLPREFIKETISYNKLLEELSRIIQHITSLQRKPILMVTVEGGNFNRSEVYETLNHTLSDSCLAVRSNYKPTTVQDEDNLFDKEKEVLDIKKMIERSLKEFDNEKVNELATGLLKELSDGDFGQPNPGSRISTRIYMIIESLHMINFKSHRDTRIEFDTGISLIIGGNGAGKSSILEAVSFALFKQHTSKRIDQLITIGQKRMSVEIQFTPMVGYIGC